MLLAPPHYSNASAYSDRSTPWSILSQTSQTAVRQRHSSWRSIEGLNHSNKHLNPSIVCLLTFLRLHAISVPSSRVRPYRRGRRPTSPLAVHTPLYTGGLGCTLPDGLCEVSDFNSPSILPHGQPEEPVEWLCYGFGDQVPFIIGHSLPLV